jgi:hypothetical protein
VELAMSDAMSDAIAYLKRAIEQLARARRERKRAGAAR